LNCAISWVRVRVRIRMRVRVGVKGRVSQLTLTLTLTLNIQHHPSLLPDLFPSCHRRTLTLTLTSSYYVIDIIKRVRVKDRVKVG
jgi:hypothetical protein